MSHWTILICFVMAIICSSEAYSRTSVRSLSCKNAELQRASVRYCRTQPTRFGLSALPPNRPVGSEKGDKNAFLGFTTRAEVLNGRLAMIFFSVGIYEEYVTGKSILQQVGFEDQSSQLSALELAALFGFLSLVPVVNKFLTRLTDKKP